MMSSMEHLEDPLGDWSESATYYPRQLRLDRTARFALAGLFTGSAIATLLSGAPLHANVVSAWIFFLIAGFRARSWKRRPEPDIFPERRRFWLILTGISLVLALSWTLSNLS